MAVAAVVAAFFQTELQHPCGRLWLVVDWGRRKGCGSEAARREWSNFGIPKFGSLSSGPGGPESRPELFASGLACEVFSATPKSSGRNPSPVRESGPRSVVVEVVVL